MNKIIISAVALVFCVALVGVWIMVKKNSVDTGFVVPISIIVASNSVSINGSLSASALWYYGYETEYRDAALYVRIKGGSINLPNSSGDFMISIPNTFGIIDKIYLQGSAANDIKLIWEKGV